MVRVVGDQYCSQVDGVLFPGKYEVLKVLCREVLVGHDPWPRLSSTLDGLESRSSNLQ